MGAVLEVFFNSGAAPAAARCHQVRADSINPATFVGSVTASFTLDYKLTLTNPQNGDEEKGKSRKFEA